MEAFEKDYNIYIYVYTHKHKQTNKQWIKLIFDINNMVVSTFYVEKNYKQMRWSLSWTYASS